jgi:hypothetical protein
MAMRHRVVTGHQSHVIRVAIGHVTYRANASRYDTAGEWRREMEKEYRVLSFSEGRELGINELYSCLVGPDEFECILTEIEDRTWGRDLRPVVNRLKEQHARIAELEAQLAAAQERWIPVSERLPECTLHVVACQTPFSPLVACYVPGEGTWYDDDGIELDFIPTHWRELPAPPEEAADANN